MQRERMTEHLVPSLREYTARYGVTTRRAAALRDDALVMHPGPMNRGVEISAEVADLPRSVILAQVRNGVAVRMRSAEHTSELQSLMRISLSVLRLKTKTTKNKNS